MVQQVNDQKWTLGRNALIGTLIVQHVWATLLVLAVLRGNSASVVGDMFAASTMGIAANLALLLGGKAWKSWLPHTTKSEGDKP